MRRWLGAVLLFSVVYLGRPPAEPVDGCCEGVAHAADRTVIFNTKSHIYHRSGCNAALACTVNCVTVTLSEAVRLGGRPCGRCGG
jgi:hypothetical protein